MVQRRTVELVDDLDGGAAHETVTFGLDGRAYQIDLSTKNAKKLRKTLGLYEKTARRLGAKHAGPTTRVRRDIPLQPDAGAHDASVIREWALSNGYDVSSRGRIPDHLREAYSAR